MIFQTHIDWQRPRQELLDIKNAGFDSVIINCGSYISSWEIARNRVMEDNKRAAFPKLINICRELKLNIAGFIVPAMDDAECRKVMSADEIMTLNKRIIRDVIAESERLGFSKVIIEPLMHVSKSQLYSVNLEYLKYAAECCTKSDTKLLIINKAYYNEGHWMRNLFSDYEQITALIDDLNEYDPNGRFAINFDCGYSNLCGQYMDFIIEQFADYIGLVTIRENDGHENFFGQLFTSGHTPGSAPLDWNGFVRGMRNINYLGDIVFAAEDSIKQYSPMIRPDAFKICKKSADFIIDQIRYENILKKYDSIVLFGAGNMCTAFMNSYGDRYNVLYTCDNNRAIWGSEFAGLTVHNPEDLKSLPDNCGVIICNMYYRDIELQLTNMGIKNIEYFTDEYSPKKAVNRIIRIDGTATVKRER